MPEHEQTLADEEKLGILDRWFKHQGIVDEVLAEREAQHAQWGVQDIPLGTGTPRFQMMAKRFRDECQKATADGTLTFAHVLLEEVFEAMAESDAQKLRDEMIQALAVGFQIVEAIDRRAAT